MLYNYKCLVINVVDGDTMDVQIDLGFGVKFEHRIRILNYDSPEIYGKVLKEEKEIGKQAKILAKKLLLNQEVIITTHKKKGKYGRYLADIFIEQETGSVNINDWLVRENLAERRTY